MHNLSGVYYKEEKPDVLEGIPFFSFSINYPKKNRIYYVESEAEFKVWLEKLRVTTGYIELNDIYDVKEVIGKGKFGLVRLGVHKESKRLVAIKIMNRKQMSNQDQELVKTEIEILKISQQPNIIQLYDIFENNDEIKISKLVVFYLSSYGTLFRWRLIHLS
jgi:serine/threonine protein kinase